MTWGLWLPAGLQNSRLAWEMQNRIEEIANGE